MGMFVAGIWTTILIGLWVYSLVSSKTAAIVFCTIFMLITTFGFGALTEEKLGSKSR
jgi:hypothetical protein